MRFLYLLFLLLAGPALAQATPARYFQETQALTRADPSGDPSLLSAGAARPLSLAGVTRYRIVLCAAGGATLSGTGTVRLWLYSQSLAAWGYGTTLSVTTSGARCQSWGLLTDVRMGWMQPAAVGVGVSSGTTVTLRVDPDTF